MKTNIWRKKNKQEIFEGEKRLGRQKEIEGGSKWGKTPIK